MRRRALATCLVLCLTAACGSTVQVRGTATLGGGSAGDGLGAVADGGASASGSAGGALAGGTSGLSGGSTTGATSPLGGSASTTGVAGAPRSGGTTGTAPGAAGVPVSGRGFTKSVLRIGVGTSSDYNSTVGSFALKGLSYDGNPNVWFDAVVADINRSGGLLGRKVELVRYDYNTTQEVQNPSAANQEACTTWTQDKPVYAVLLAGFEVEDTLLSCLKRAQTPLIEVGGGLDYPLHYAESYAKYPLFFNLDQMLGETFDAVAVGRLAARGYFAPWNTRTGAPAAAAAKTLAGIVGFDDHDGALQIASETKQLRSHGVATATPVLCPRALTSKISCEQSAVLRFASAGVTHVFGADSTFMNNANSQAYYPRYFVAAEPALFAANVPAKQLAGAMSEGYVPLLDTPADHYPGDPSPATARCFALMKAAGQATTDPLTRWLQTNICDEFSFLRAAVAKAGTLGPQALAAGLEQLGTSVPSAMTWSAGFSPRQHASATVLRDLSYDSGLKNFVYTSRTNHGSAG